MSHSPFKIVNADEVKISFVNISSHMDCKLRRATGQSGPASFPAIEASTPARGDCSAICRSLVPY